MTFHFSQHANTKRGHVACLICKTFAAKCPFSPRLKYCIFILFSFLHLMTSFICLNNNISFGQHTNTERGHVPCLLCKTFAAKCLFLQGLSMYFMVIYKVLHLMTFDLILLALIIIFHLGNMQTLRECRSRVLTL